MGHKITRVTSTQMQWTIHRCWTRFAAWYFEINKQLHGWRRRRKSFPTSLIAPRAFPKNLSQEPKMFLFMQNEEYAKTLIETWLNTHFRVLGPILLSNTFILAQRNLKLNALWLATRWTSHLVAQRLKHYRICLSNLPNKPTWHPTIGFGCRVQVAPDTLCVPPDGSWSTSESSLYVCSTRRWFSNAYR